jgi:hypothetical protein
MHREIRPDQINIDHSTPMPEGRAMLLFTWTAVATRSARRSGSLGVSDDSERALQAAESCLRTGQARLAYVESVQPAMVAHSLNPVYLPTGSGWWATPPVAGDVDWVPYSDRDTAAGLRALAESADWSRK